MYKSRWSKINRLRDFRVKADKSQIQLSKETGVAQATISNIEAGNRTPSYLTRQRLANALGFPVEEIFPNEGNLTKRGRGKSAAAKSQTIGDILITNSQANLSTTAVKKLSEEETATHLVKDSKIVGFIFSSAGRRLKYFPIRLFKDDEFIDGTYTDAIGKFTFESLKNGEYRLSTEDKNISLKIKG